MTHVARRYCDRSNWSPASAGVVNSSIVILTKVRIQSHKRRRRRLWILDQVQDDE
jgi:hypothetical protein